MISNIKHQIKNIAIKITSPMFVLKLIKIKGKLSEFLKINPPFTLYIDVSNCALKCTLCPNGDNYPFEGPGRGKMSLTLFKRIVEKFVEENITVKLFAIGNWGEAMLNPEIHQIIHYAKTRSGFMRKGGKISVNTTLNNLPNPSDFLKSGVNEVRITISGMTQAIYSKYHKGGDIERVKSNILKLVEIRDSEKINYLNLKLVFLNFTYNKKDSELAEEFCRKHKLIFTPVDSRLLCVDCFIYFKNEKEKMSKMYNQFVDLLTLTSKSTTIDADNVEFCNLRWNYVTVNFDGQLFPCCGVFEKKHFLGSLFDFKIKDIPKIESKICKICATTPMNNSRDLIISKNPKVISG